MLTRLLAPRADAVYAALRIVTGFAFSFHGLQKVFGVLTDFQAVIPSQIWIGGVIELLGGLAMMVGAFTTWAAFLCSGTMAVAYTQFHWKGQLGAQLLPGINQGELALVYAFLFLYFACRGAGPCSFDRWWHRRRRSA